jgi:hypothetical protein
LRAALTEPVLVWLFAVSVLMYIFSHILFVFGQPFILEALKDTGVQEDAPLVSGTVSALMMLLSVAASLAAPTLRRKLGLPMILMIAFAIQIALSGTLALSTSMLAISVLVLRIIPDALSWPFIVARVQPMLSSESRATYLSLQSFAGRLILAATLYLAALATSGQGQMVHSEIRQVLGWYVGAGLLSLAALAVAATRLSIEPDDKPT